MNGRALYRARMLRARPTSLRRPCRLGENLQREQDRRGPVEVAAVQDGVGGFGNSSAGSVAEWNVPAAKVFFNDLITGTSVAGTA
jgi:hypothetical protein